MEKRMSKLRYGWKRITKQHHLHSGGEFTEVVVNDVRNKEPIATFYGANAKLNSHKFINWMKTEEEKRYVL